MGEAALPRSQCIIYVDLVHPLLYFEADSLVQTLRMHKLVRWEFHHFYRGTPHRHLLDTGWSRFVNTKLLVAGDAIQMGSSCLSGYDACLATSSSFQRGFHVICFCKEEKLPSMHNIYEQLNLVKPLLLIHEF